MKWAKFGETHVEAEVLVHTEMCVDLEMLRELRLLALLRNEILKKFVSYMKFQ